MVKYAEDQHKKKDQNSRRGLMGPGGPMGMNMMDNMGMMNDHMKQDFYSRQQQRMPPTMYRNQQSSPMQLGQMGGHNPGGNQGFNPPSGGGYSSGRGLEKNMGSSSTSNPNSLDWYGQMPQMVYDNQMANAQMINQSLGYDQHSIDHHMMGQSQQRSGQNQGNLYMRSPRSSQEPGYSSSVTVVIGCLPQHADVALLHDLCAPYGRIISAMIDVDTNSGSDGGSRSSGRGRVQMAGLSQAQYATQALNGAIIFEGGRPLQVDEGKRD